MGSDIWSRGKAEMKVRMSDFDVYDVVDEPDISHTFYKPRCPIGEDTRSKR